MRTDKATAKMKEGRIDLGGHTNCTNHIGRVCGDFAAFATRNDPDMFARIMDAAAAADR